MRTRHTGRPSLWVSVPLIALVAGSAGIFWPSIYAHEKPGAAAGGMGVDVVDLAVVVPLLIVCAVLARHGSIAATLVWMGSLGYLIYNFMFAAFAVHFNALFLAYCGVLGLSVFGFIALVPSLPTAEIATSYGPRAPAKSVAASFVLLALAAGSSELKEIISAIIAGQVPPSVANDGYLTNPIHVLDLCLLLPALVIVGVMLLRRRALAFVFAPVLLTVQALISLELAGMFAAMNMQGIVSGYPQIGLFVALTATYAGLLVWYFRSATGGLEPVASRGAAESALQAGR